MAVTGVIVAMMHAGDGRAATGERWQDLISPSQVNLRAISQGIANETLEEPLRRAIRAADASFTVDELTTVVRIASICCRVSQPVSQGLTQWLRESHAIYSGRLPTEVSQFRGFLLASLGSFVPDEDLYGYVKAEFLFGGHAFDVATAAVAARRFAERADELVPLMEPYLGSTFTDSWVDVTTPELNYPLVNPTRARYEIIRTLVAFGPRAKPALPQLDAITRCPNCGTYASDTALPVRAAKAAEYIRRKSPLGNGNEAIATSDAPVLRLIDKRQRMPAAMMSLKLIDQEGRSLAFANLQGRPFALSFFYSQCANALKCILTVRRLGALASECADSGLADRVGVYGMTYASEFDSPSILKRYGKMYGMKFDRNVRLFKTSDSIPEEFRRELALRVSYGGGSVNHHGIQLFVFDKKGRLAATQDNEIWSPVEVKDVLAKLAAE